MKKYAAYALSVSLIIIGLFVLAFAVRAIKPKGQGALQVITNIKGSVALDEKPLGNTPLCKCEQGNMLQEGTYTLTVSPDDKTLTPYTAKITIAPGVLTAVERTFLPGSLASSYILTLERSNSTTPQLVVTSIPTGSMVTIDGSPQGITPYLQQNITASEHELEIQKAGYGKKTIKIRAVGGYKLIANVFLGTGQNEADQTAIPSPTLSITPTASPSGAASASVKILQTPTGFLNVRKGPGAGNAIVGRALPGDIYPYIGEQSGWFEITFKGQNGWISSQYSQKVTTP